MPNASRDNNIATRAAWVRPTWWILVLVGLGFAYAGTVHWMVRYRWFHADGLYEHAPLILAFALWVLWRERQALGAIPRQPGRGGIPLLLGGCFLHLVGVFMYRDSLSGFALIPLLVGLVLAVEGKERTRRLLPLILLLCFVIPLPDQLLKAFTFPLKMGATNGGAWFAGLFLGADMRLVGTEIFFPGQRLPLVVGDACSGMRSAMALLTLGYCQAFFFGPSGYRRLVIILAALPVAFVANAFRIALLILVAAVYDVSTATGRVHDLLGYGVYFIAFGLLLALDLGGRSLWRFLTQKERA